MRVVVPGQVAPAAPASLGQPGRNGPSRVVVTPPAVLEPAAVALPPQDVLAELERLRRENAELRAQLSRLR